MKGFWKKLYANNKQFRNDLITHLVYTALYEQLFIFFTLVVLLVVGW